MRSRNYEFGFDGAYGVVMPACPELSSVFFTLRNHVEADAAHGCQVVRRAFPLVWTQQDCGHRRVSAFYAGLAPFVLRQLKRLGHHVTIVPRPRTLLSEPARWPWDLAESADEALLRLVQQHERGLAYYSRQHVEPERLIAQVARAWPKLEIVIPVTRISDAWRVRKRLAKWVPAGRIEVFTHRAHSDQRKPIVIGTYTQLGGGAVALHERQILLSLQPAEMIGCDIGREVIRTARVARMYGIVPADTPLTTYQRDWLLALFGKQTIHIPNHGKTIRPVQVVFAPVFGGQPIPADVDVVQLKRLGVWHNPVRNRRIAALAELLATKNISGIALRFPEVAPVARQLARARVGVLVENSDHGLLLGRSLSDWPIVAGQTAALCGLTDAERARLCHDAEVARRSDRVIVTTAGLAEAGRLDFVVRADAGVGLPRLELAVRQVLLRHRPRCLTLIDTDDQQHPELVRRSGQRREEYSRQGWKLVGDPRTDLDLFLDHRPRVV